MLLSSKDVALVTGGAQGVGKGMFLNARAVGRLMAEQRRGRIVNISSCSARKPDPGPVAYNASKSAIVGLTRVTALELGPLTVTCNAVLPGTTFDTEMTWSSQRRQGRGVEPDAQGSTRAALRERRLAHTAFHRERPHPRHPVGTHPLGHFEQGRVRA